MDDESDWAKVERDFRENGFLASSATRFRTHFRAVMPEWFSLAEEFNRFGQSLYGEAVELIHGRGVKDPTSTAIQIMPRSLGAFQGSLLLAELGMGIEALNLVRTIFESAFWLGYIKKAPEQAIPEFEYATLEGEVGLFKSSQRYLRGLSPETKKMVEEGKAAMESRLRLLPKAPNVEKLANRSGFGDNYFLYKDLSGSATHTSRKSIHRYLRHDEEGDVVGHQCGPDEDEAGRAVWLACRAMKLVCGALIEICGLNQHEGKFEVLCLRMDELVPYRPSFTPNEF